MISENADEAVLRENIKTPANNVEQALFVSETLPQTGRVMVKDETFVYIAGCVQNVVQQQHLI